MWLRAALLLVVAGCDLQDLTHDKLFGPPTPVADGGRPARPVLVAVSGTVSSACDGASLDALVGIAGRHTCSVSGKGAFFFRIDDLPGGMTVSLTAAKAGYRPYSAAIALAETGVVHNVQLVPMDGDCATNPHPPTMACSCTMASCIPQ